MWLRIKDGEAREVHSDRIIPMEGMELIAHANGFEDAEEFLIAYDGDDIELNMQRHVVCGLKTKRPELC